LPGFWPFFCWVAEGPFVSAVHFQQQKSNHLVRKELQAHLSAHQQMLAGYTDYIKRHTHVLLQLVLNNPQVREMLLNRRPLFLKVVAGNGIAG
jgi:hypothetical protein